MLVVRAALEAMVKTTELNPVEAWWRLVLSQVSQVWLPVTWVSVLGYTVAKYAPIEHIWPWQIVTHQQAEQLLVEDWQHSLDERVVKKVMVVEVDHHDDPKAPNTTTNMHTELEQDQFMIDTRVPVLPTVSLGWDDQKNPKQHGSVTNQHQPVVQVHHHLELENTAAVHLEAETSAMGTTSLDHKAITMVMVAAVVLPLVGSDVFNDAIVIVVEVRPVQLDI